LKLFVVDCSVAMAWYFEDEVDPYADAVLEKLEGAEAVVPVTWTIEVANALAAAERRARISSSYLSRILVLIGNLPLRIDEETSTRALGPILSLARQESLSSYDAAYLDPAMRQGLPLATLDKAMRKAARALGVALIPD
jgi:predicted nucleic acid-binding protein